MKIWVVQYKIRDDSYWRIHEPHPMAFSTKKEADEVVEKRTRLYGNNGDTQYRAVLYVER